jgi:hypothetical protein
MTGERVLSDPQASLIASRYSTLVPGSEVRLPGETRDAYQSRIRQDTTRYFLKHPSELTRLFASHYLNNQVSILLLLPSSYPVLFNLQITPQDHALPGLYWLALKDQCCSLENYVRNSPYWFRQAEVNFSGGKWIPLVASLILFSIGIGFAWSRARLVSLVPLSMLAVYGLGSAAIRYSGWRYNLPVDWVGILYYGAGLVQVCFLVAMFFKNRFIPRAWESGPEVRSHTGNAEAPLPWKSILLAGTGFFLITAAIPLSERLVPKAYLGAIGPATIPGISTVWVST